MNKIIFNQKLINFFKKIKEAILNNGFSRYIVDTIAPTFRFFSFILKNINKIYFFLIKRVNLKKILPYTVIIALVIFTAFVPEIFKSTYDNRKIINNQTEEYTTNDTSIDQMLKKSFLTSDTKKLGLDFQQVVSIINLFEKSGYNLEKVREGEPVANFFLAKLFYQRMKKLLLIEES